MPIQSSFPKVADQILTLNKNVIDVLTKINSITTTTESSVTVQLYDDKGILRNFTLPTISSLKSEIERLNNNINSLYNIDTTGSMIQTSPGTFKKVVTVDLNREPAAINTLGAATTFVATNNWFFDSMINPMLSVEFDLTGQIEDNVRRIQTRRYIVDFEKDGAGNLTANGQSALNSFNASFRGNSSITITDFESWHKTTPGVLDGQNPKIDDQIFDLEPNELLYQGEFSVIRQQEDRVNRKLYYVIDTTQFTNLSTGQIERLTVGHEMILNLPKSTTRYRITEISTVEVQPKIRLERVEGMEPVPVGTGILKIYSPVISKKTVAVSVGYDERNVIFAKPINTDGHLLARDWSKGSGFYTNDLRLSSTTSDNGTTMEQFYTDFVYDYGTVIKDMVAKKIPNILGGTPVAPTLTATNFQVVQINKHLTDTPNSKLLKQKHNYQQTLKSEIQQISQAIIDMNKKTKVEKNASASAKKTTMLEIDELTKKKDSRSKLLSTVTQEILDLSKNPNNKVAPKFAARGFWTIPDPVIVKGSKSQEIVQFKIQYKYLSKDGKESPVQSYKIDDTQTTGVISNWIEMKTEAKRRIFDPATNTYTWEAQDVSNAEVPNINQLDIPIQPNEKIEVRIKSLTEVGWPESPVESDWSEILTVEFPTDLDNVLNENETIKNEASKEEVKISLQADLSAKGLDEHLSDTMTVNNKIFHHESKRILSGFTNENGIALDLYEYLDSLQQRIKSLEEKIKRAKGELKVVIRAKEQETVVEDGRSYSYIVQCEDHLDKYEETGVNTNRVYQNRIYKIEDYEVRIMNASADSPLGLLSDRNYGTSTDIYDKALPQVFWVDENDQLIVSNSSGSTKTQLDNQIIWSVNYDTGAQKNNLARAVDNQFIKNNTNSVTDILGSDAYNLGFGSTGLLQFVGNDLRLIEPSKWTEPQSREDSSSVTKLLTTVHPVVKKLETIRETNADKLYSLSPGDQNTLRIPVNIYFKMNSLDNTVGGENFTYVSINNTTKNVKHVKKVKFLLYNEAENKSFKFTIEFTINRQREGSSFQKNYTTPYIVRNDLNNDYSI